MITRFAPSLTGYLHLGHVYHMIQVWGMARRTNSNVLSRIEDHDIARNRPEYEPAVLADMEWLGFSPAIGISASEAPHPSPYRQSDCSSRYEEALRLLSEKGLVYGCECSRKQIMQSSNGGTPASASTDSGDDVPPIQYREPCYPGTCARKNLPLDGNTVRFRVPEGQIEFNDLKLGNQSQSPAMQCGDFSLRDRHGQWTYQFCCVCDDIVQDISLVVRGEDILSSTGRQMLLFRAMDHEPPQYFHHDLLSDEQGQKLSKRQRSQSITQLRENGASPDDVIGRAAFAGGLIPEDRPLSAHSIIANMAESGHCGGASQSR